jgi:hypothetical protein
LGSSIYKEFQSKKERTVVREDDIKMYNWVDMNIVDDVGIIINAYRYLTYIMPSDSGGWIGVFTSNKITAPYWEASYPQTEEFYELYNSLKKNPNQCQIIQAFREEGFEYYFQGSTPYIDSSIPLSADSPGGGWEVVHKEGEVVLYKLPECKYSN